MEERWSQCFAGCLTPSWPPSYPGEEVGVLLPLRTPLVPAGSMGWGPPTPGCHPGAGGGLFVWKVRPQDQRAAAVSTSLPLPWCPARTQNKLESMIWEVDCGVSLLLEEK